MSSLLVGKKAPSFKGKAVRSGEIVEDFSLEQFLGKYLIFFFYPLNFTFVCPTELHKFQERLSEFREKNAEVVGCSVDSPYSHLAWLELPKSKGGIQGVTYPLVSDLTKEIARSYCVLNENEGIAFRGLFLIDRNGIIRQQLVNDLPIGRSVDETLRTLEALNFYEEKGEVCPADWRLGDKALEPTLEGLYSYFT